jgi:hypothetical protein
MNTADGHLKEAWEHKQCNEVLWRQSLAHCPIQSVHLEREAIVGQDCQQKHDGQEQIVFSYFLNLRR